MFILRNNQTPELQYYYARCKSLVREIWRSFAREKDILWCKASKTPRSRTPKVNLFAYSLEPTKPDGEEGEDQDEIDQENGDSKHEITACQLIHRFLCHYQSSLCLNLHQRHFSYIKDMNTYSKSYCCSRCGTFPKHVSMLHRHERTFKAKVQYQFPGGTYRTPPTIFQLLEDERFTIPRHLKYFPYRATFDFECMLNPMTGLIDTEKLTWDAKHIPLSASVCSNVPVYDQPKCCVSDGDSKQLVKETI